MADFRNERLGISHTARMLNVRVSDLTEAINLERPLFGDVMPPQPLGRFGTKREMLFQAGDVLDCQEALKKAKEQAT